MEKPADSPQPPLPPASGEIEELPVTLEADFAPLKDAGTTDLDDQSDAEPHHDESLRAQEAFELAAQAAAVGDEERAVRQYLKASNLAEAAREWYLAAVSCQRVGDFLQNERPPEDLERAFRMYRRGSGRLRAVWPLRRGPPPLVPPDGPEDAPGTPITTLSAGAD